MASPPHDQQTRRTSNTDRRSHQTQSKLTALQQAVTGEIERCVLFYINYPHRNAQHKPSSTDDCAQGSYPTQPISSYHRKVTSWRYARELGHHSAQTQVRKCRF